MRRIPSSLLARSRSEQGASSVEYGLLVALIAAVIVVAVLLVGGVVRGAFQDTKTGTCNGTDEASTSADCPTSD